MSSGFSCYREKRYNLKKLIDQIIKFTGVGVLCFFIDFAILYCLTEWAGWHYLVSAAAAFTGSVIVNYILSVKFVFDTNERYQKSRNFALFIIFSIIGLLLTELIMKIGVDGIGLNYLLVKIGATAIVMVYNFITRKKFLE